MVYSQHYIRVLSRNFAFVALVCCSIYGNGLLPPRQSGTVTEKYGMKCKGHDQRSAGKPRSTPMRSRRHSTNSHHRGTGRRPGGEIDAQIGRCWTPMEESRLRRSLNKAIGGLIRQPTGHRTQTGRDLAKWGRRAVSRRIARLSRTTIQRARKGGTPSNKGFKERHSAVPQSLGLRSDKQGGSQRAAGKRKVDRARISLYEES